MALFDKL
jgi:hypothetical protein